MNTPKHRSGSPRPPRPILAQGKTYVVIFREKHGSRYFVVENEQALFAVSLKVLRARMAHYGCWYVDADEVEECVVIDQTGDGLAAYRFLQGRSDRGFEYERMEVECAEDY